MRRTSLSDTRRFQPRDPRLSALLPRCLRLGFGLLAQHTRRGNGSQIRPNAAHHVVSHRISDCARIRWFRDPCIWVDCHIRRARNLETENWLCSIARRLSPHADRQKTLDRPYAKRRLVAVPLYTPREHADLIEIERQSRFGRTHRSHILWNLVIGHVGLRIGYLHQHVRAYDALAFGILAYLIRHIHIHAPGSEPAYAPLGIPDEPPVFHRHLGLRWLLT